MKESIHSTTSDNQSGKEKFFQGIHDHTSSRHQLFFKPAPAYIPSIARSQGQVVQRADADGSGSGDSNYYGLGEALGVIANISGPLNAVGIASFNLPDGLPRRLLFQYAYAGGKGYSLNIFEMRECKPDFDFNGTKFETAYQQALSTRKPTFVESTARGYAGLTGTLGQFTVKYSGMLSLSPPNDDVVFNGSMEFYDKYDFDQHKGTTQRSDSGQFKTGFGSMIPGTAFTVTSQRVKVLKIGRKPPVW